MGRTAHTTGQRDNSSKIIPYDGSVRFEHVGEIAWKHGLRGVPTNNLWSCTEACRRDMGLRDTGNKKYSWSLIPQVCTRRLNYETPVHQTSLRENWTENTVFCFRETRKLCQYLLISYCDKTLSHALSVNCHHTRNHTSVCWSGHCSLPC
jgi:hypothetical protein